MDALKTTDTFLAQDLAGPDQEIRRGRLRLRLVRRSLALPRVLFSVFPSLDRLHRLVAE